MDIIEIILEDVNKKKLDTLVEAKLLKKDFELKSSHFYDYLTDKDLEFCEIESLSTVMNPKGSGNMFFRNICLGINIVDVVTIFSFDELIGDIEFSFNKNNLKFKSRKDFNSKIALLLRFLMCIKSEFDIPLIKIGYEPAVDDDMLILSIDDQPADIVAMTEKLYSELY